MKGCNMVQPWKAQCCLPYTAHCGRYAIYRISSHFLWPADEPRGPNIYSYSSYLAKRRKRAKDGRSRSQIRKRNISTFKCPFSPTAEFHLKGCRATKVREPAASSDIVVEIYIHMLSLTIGHIERIVIHLIHHDELLVQLRKGAELPSEVPIVKVRAELTADLRMTGLILRIAGA